MRPAIPALRQESLSQRHSLFAEAEKRRREEHGQNRDSQEELVHTVIEQPDAQSKLDRTNENSET